MKIIYCIAAMHSPGGMERVLANKANYLARKGYDILIVTTDQCGLPPFFRLDERIRCYDLDINYEENNGKSFLTKLLHYPLKQYRHKQRLTALLKLQRADVVVSMFCNDVSFISDIHDGSSKVLEIHFSKYKRMQYNRHGLWRLSDWYRSRTDEYFVRKFRRFVVLTAEDAGYWGALSNMVVIPNSLSFYPVQFASLNNKCVIAVGRYDYQKGFDRLIQAWTFVHQAHPDWTLHIIGKGALSVSLQNQINANDLQSSVHLQSPSKCMETTYLAASVFVLSSRYEGLPMVLLEAQACGLPVVSFRCKCGPGDLITDGKDGFLVPDGDIKALACQIIHLIENDFLRKRVGEKARENVIRFSEENIMPKWENLFHELVTQR